MSENQVFRPEKRRLSANAILQEDSDVDSEVEAEAHPLQNIREVQRATASARGEESPFAGESPIKLKGNIPPQMLAAMQAAQKPQAQEQQDDDQFQVPLTRANHKSDGANTPRRRADANPFAEANARPTNSQFEALLSQLKQTTHHYSQVELPSKGKFYDGTDGPINGILHLRPMTGDEEQILATPRFGKGGKAIDMIFRNCIQERINPEKLLTADRTHVLIFLRGISYGRNYDVEIKCLECSQKFATTVDLDNALDVEECPDDFDVDSLTDTLPISGFRFSYRLSRGRDEAAVAAYRDKKLKSFSDASDDTLAYRAALLITEIEGVTDHHQIQALHRQLPIGDVSFIRNLINEPPFGVNTEIPMSCPFCYADFKTDLPLDTGFFFPKTKKKEAQSN